MNHIFEYTHTHTIVLYFFIASGNRSSNSGRIEDIGAVWRGRVLRPVWGTSIGFWQPLWSTCLSVENGLFAVYFDTLAGGTTQQVGSSSFSALGKSISFCRSWLVFVEQTRLPSIKWASCIIFCNITKCGLVYKIV